MDPMQQIRTFVRESPGGTPLALRLPDSRTNVRESLA
jgi:hypothetical protein